MKILVPVKRVVDYNVKIRVKGDGTGVELANVKMSMNPFDEIAVEEALRLKEKGQATEIVCRLDRAAAGVRDHPHRARDGRRPRHPGEDRQLRRAARGRQNPQSHRSTPKQPGLVILGKQAIDDDCNQTGQMLAALTGWPQGTFASKLVIEGDAILVTREVDGGLQTVKLKTPGDRHHRSAPQRAALCEPAQHHEGEEEADRRQDAGGLRRRRHAAARSAQDQRAGRAQVRRQGQDRRRAGRQAQKRGGSDLS